MILCRDYLIRYLIHLNCYLANKKINIVIPKLKKIDVDFEEKKRDLL